MKQPLLNILEPLAAHDREKVFTKSRRHRAVDELKISLPPGVDQSQADDTVPRYVGKLIWFETLSPEQRRQNLAERLVVACRILDARR